MIGRSMFPRGGRQRAQTESPSGTSLPNSPRPDADGSERLRPAAGGSPRITRYEFPPTSALSSHPVVGNFGGHSELALRNRLNQ